MLQNKLTEHSNFNIPVKNITIKRNIKNCAIQIIKEINIGNNFILVCDTNSFEAFGRILEAELKKNFKIKLLCFNGDISATDIIASEIRKEISYFDAVIAVGSGTINDLCKYSSYSENKPYIIFGTALSMNGYASPNASISVNGQKKSFLCHLPEAVFMDTEVLVNSPSRLTKSGIGDLLSTGTSNFDWLLSHLLLDTPYNSLPFELLKTLKEDIFDHADLIIKGDSDLTEKMSEMLILSGLGMYFCKGSYPASQAEHMLCHTMEAMGYNDLKMLHGEQVGVTTLSIAKIQEDIIREGLKLKEPEKKPFYRENIYNFFGKESGKEYIKEYDIKHDLITESNICKKKSEIPEIENSLNKVLVSEKELLKVLRKINTVTEVIELGWPEDIYKKAIKHCKYTRNRFTCLDVL